MASELPPLSEADRRAAFDAFQRAESAGRKLPECYLAAVDELHKLHPGFPRYIVASQTVTALTSHIGILELANERRLFSSEGAHLQEAFQ